MYAMREDYNTRACNKKRVNCGKAHRAWQKRECDIFKAYKNNIGKLRRKMVIKAAAIRKGLHFSRCRNSP